jgi:hypothetical protein
MVNANVVFRDKIPSGVSFPLQASDLPASYGEVAVYFAHQATWVRQACPFQGAGELPLIRIQRAAPSLRVRNARVDPSASNATFHLLAYSVPSSWARPCRVSLSAVLRSERPSEFVVWATSEGRARVSALPNWC